MKTSMDLFGKALLDYWKENKTKFYFVSKTEGKYEFNLGRYFRKPSSLTILERKLISLCFGKILDVGCATGYYIPSLMKKGKVMGIDISEDAIKICNENGLKNCKVADIFSFKLKKKFDTIVLLENNLGLAGSLKKAKQLLKILSNLLNEKGQILTISRKVTKVPYMEAEMYPLWKGKKGQKFKWISFNIKFLSNLCEKEHMKLEVLGKDRYNYLVKITKNKK